MNKAYKIRLYPNEKQKQLIDRTIGCSRFIFNQMLAERIKVYEELKDDKEKLYDYKYKTEKEYKEEFPFLKDVSSRALQQSRLNLDKAYKNFFRRVREGNKKVGFPKFKSKHKTKASYREPNVSFCIEIQNNKIKLLKLGLVRFRGLSKDFSGTIKSVTITRLKDFTYEASILVERSSISKERKSNNILGLDLGIKDFVVCSNGEVFNGIKNTLSKIESKIKKQQKHLSRKIEVNKKKEIKDSKRFKRCKIKLAKLYKYKTDFQNHFFWHLANKLCSENQAIVIEDLNVAGMKQNRKLAHSIHYSGWSKFIGMLQHKAVEYGTIIEAVDRFFPSSKTCSNCGQIKKDLTLSNRTYMCDCGLEIDRDLNASINLRNYYLKNNSVDYIENTRGENVRPRRINYDFSGSFYEAF